MPVARLLTLLAFLFAPAPAMAADSVPPEVPLPTEVMPAGWTIAVPQQHPCLLFGPEDRDTIKARMLKRFGSLDAMHDHWLAAWLSDDESLHRKATDDFIAYWKDYAKRWGPGKLDVARPDGVAMRGIWRTIYVYDLVKSFGLLTPEQDAEYRDTLVRSIEYALGHTAGTHRSPGTLGWRSMNIYSDLTVLQISCGEQHDRLELRERSVSLVRKGPIRAFSGKL